ncbi:unnamed protein product (macronuclear) [Paramecium tetraurelia]|uniref:Tim10-like domain-containing protein n=1 Tax=Paramecium tetraurelia TaxID=5888 RepID=A0D6Y1_PARTE|nr:uncharacterized protein GSPATT00001839001 [Paramecium tetraurelia]CAK78798.1 unnamed protein product [Paramecium tetraurelia]|eukprot:XP_001446195.1 hypothetical protein (macronuclear) [Paramecium tetraurelia strain d4-2]
MDPQLNAQYEITRKDLNEFMQECYQYCISEYKRGQEDVIKQMLKYAQQESNGDISKTNINNLLNYLKQRRNQLLPNGNNTPQVENQSNHNTNKKTFVQVQQNEPQKFIVINHERLQRAFEELK